MNYMRNFYGMCLAIALVATTGAANAQDKLVYGGLRGGGSSILVPQRLADDKELQKKYGLDVSVKIYGAQDLYPAMVRGDYNATFVPASSLAAQAIQGMPVQVISTVEPDKAIVFLGKGDKITSADQLRGKRIAALASAGSWLSLQAQMDERFKIRAKQDYEVVAVSSFGAAAAQVAAGTADYAISWQPSTSASLLRIPDLHVVLTAGDLKDYVTWRLIIGVYGNMPNDLKDRQIKALAEAAKWLQANPAEADKTYSKLLELQPGIIEKILSGPRDHIDIHPLSKADIDAIQRDLALVVKGGGLQSLPDKATFYYQH